MKKSLSLREYVYVASMLFGMFFGAGNLIFPVLMGQLSGKSVWTACIGFLITGVGLPLLSVAALGISRSSGLFELAAKVGRPYGVFFSCLLYLTIGPFFAIPRCATTSFTVGLESLLPETVNLRLCLLLFSLLFFGAALFFSLRPGRILTWIGKILNPCFLIFLCVLIAVAFVKSPASISEVEPVGSYSSKPLFTGFIEGYNTMDVLAGLAFGIVVVQVIKDLGVTESGAVARNTVRAGVFSCVVMAVIYVAVAIMGAQSRGVLEPAANGGIAFAEIAETYLGKIGLVILSVTVTLACLKTAIGLITSCAEGFAAMFPKGPSYAVWTVLFSVGSFLFANLGLDAIIDYSLPVLMFLYPLSIALILLAAFGRFFGHDKTVYAFTVGATLIGALYDLLRTLPDSTRALLRLDSALELVGKILPFSSLGLAWVCPAAIGLIIGLIVRAVRLHKKQASV